MELAMRVIRVGAVAISVFAMFGLIFCGGPLGAALSLAAVGKVCLAASLTFGGAALVGVVGLRYLTTPPVFVPLPRVRPSKGVTPPPAPPRNQPPPPPARKKPVPPKPFTDRETHTKPVQTPRPQRGGRLPRDIKLGPHSVEDLGENVDELGGVSESAQEAVCPTVRGIVRVGNTCWVNSLAQFLRKDRNWMNWLATEPDAAMPWVAFNAAYERAHGAVDSSQAGELRAHIHRTHQPIPEDPLLQQDASEGLVALLDLLPEDRRVPYRETSYYEYQADRPRTVASLNYGYLSIGIAGRERTLAALMRQHEVSVNNDPAVAIDGAMLVRQEYRFVQAPPSLTIHLKRFDNNGAKINTPLDIPDEYTLQPLEGGPANYRLDALIVHLGASVRGGHYVAYVKEGDQWYKIDDDCVTRANDREMARAKASAYLVHYSAD